jgi:hypothetical protein
MKRLYLVVFVLLLAVPVVMAQEIESLVWCPPDGQAWEEHARWHIVNFDGEDPETGFVHGAENIDLSNLIFVEGHTRPIAMDFIVEQGQVDYVWADTGGRNDIQRFYDPPLSVGVTDLLDAGTVPGLRNIVWCRLPGDPTATPTPTGTALPTPTPTGTPEPTPTSTPEPPTSIGLTGVTGGYSGGLTLQPMDYFMGVTLAFIVFLVFIFTRKKEDV